VQCRVRAARLRTAHASLAICGLRPAGCDFGWRAAAVVAHWRTTGWQQQAGSGSDVSTGRAGAGLHGARFRCWCRVDVVPWSVLTAVTTKNEKNRVLPAFNTGQLALNQTAQRIQGYMMPLELGERQRHLLLSSVPLTCGFACQEARKAWSRSRREIPSDIRWSPWWWKGAFWC
jgi:hypothetical protein